MPRTVKQPIPRAVRAAVRAAGTASATQPAHPITYRVTLDDVHAHLFGVTLTIAKPSAQQRVSLPVWIPGSYLVREFSKHLSGLQAQQDGKSAPTVQQIDKCTWQIACKPGKPLAVSYQVYAGDNSVRSALLDAHRGFFNGTSLCLRVEGQEALVHGLALPPPSAVKGWSAATGLTPVKVNKQGFGLYAADNYDELVDCPVELGTFWSGQFKACGVAHRFVVAGALPSFDGAQLLADTQKICEAEIRFWHGSGAKPPFKSYLFMLNAVDDGYGGLEHRNSTALICNRKDLPRRGDSKVSDGYTTLRGLISHEYFHTWSVKRLRPAEFARYDYGQENYTELLWFFEGFTSYYDDLLLRRAGLLDNAGYLKLLNKTINQVMQTPGEQVQSVAEASFDAWVKYYRQDENTPNATVSYYTKGALVALCFDLTLRALPHAPSLDQVMRALWQRCRAGPMTQADFAAALADVSGQPMDAEIARWVHGKGSLPLEPLLAQHGVTVVQDQAQLAQRLGLRVSESAGLLRILAVLRGGAAEQAGFAAGDEWLGVEAAEAQPEGTASHTSPAASGWKMSKLDDLLLYAAPAGAGKPQRVTALIARDKRLHRLQLCVPLEATTWRLVPRDSALVDSWLSGAV